MKKIQDIGSRLAFAGIGAAVSVVFILIGYFVRYVSLSCTVLSSIGIMIPLTQKYYREAVIAAVVAGVIGFFVVNVQIVPYAMASGLYIVLTVACKEKWSDAVWKLALSYFLKLAYSVLVFWICYSVVGAITVDTEKITFLKNLDEKTLYAVGNVLFSLAFLVYDGLVLWGYRYACQKVKAIKKGK